MLGPAVAVIDTSVLLNLAAPVVDGRPQDPSGADPLKAILTAYDAHILRNVLDEVTDATGNDLLAAATDLVLKALHHLTTHDIDDRTNELLDQSLIRANLKPSGYLGRHVCRFMLGTPKLTLARMAAHARSKQLSHG